MNETIVNPKIENNWKMALWDTFQSEEFKSLRSFLKQEYQTKMIFPPAKDIFNAFNFTPLNKVKVVILGQDPYHGPGQANGLCFSVKNGIKIPPSLQNIYKECAVDIGFRPPNHGDLSHWAKQGVLLLNATLSVENGKAGSHQKKGWEYFTDEVIKTLNNHHKGLVFLLWGNFAKQKEKFIDPKKHHLLHSVHPSPLSAHRGFFGCKHFSTVNELLKKQGRTPIDWEIKSLK